MSKVHAPGPHAGEGLCGHRAKITTFARAKVTCRPCRRLLAGPLANPKRAAFEAAKQPALPGLESAVAIVTGRPRRAPWAPNPNAAHPQDRDDWCRECETHYNAGRRACHACDMAFRPPEWSDPKSAGAAS